MTSSHTRLTPDLPPIVDVPDLPGAQLSEPVGREPEECPRDGSVLDIGPGHGGGAHHGHDGRHNRAGEDSGG
ncbi:hypothetical protein [Streptomyces albireticuli]|uniref:Uncharacterized protein n=1 Tax=Streptomyces albireticuli TaxID=1940 RepID=A0A2A2DCM4_9ACTN|nr:hypothetical protein [Streptomyces albireticuli]MCD9141093.1 hypothetical protein [Streptomyces albireticuli]MCD9160946.1 hypothetical protein [Streptomyces albireticuli]MCD9190997.1 hypothetical protein [Streptomyces albireticuli]PAU50223.1 hypothetical protein CK936_03775 [Streptomyces albireticuli]